MSRKHSLQRQGELQKRNRLWAKQQLCTCMSLFRTFLCRQCTTTIVDVKMPNFMFYVWRKPTTKFSFLCEGEFAFICQSKWVGIILMKIENPRIQFLSDDFPCLRRPCIVSSPLPRVVVLFTFLPFTETNPNQETPDWDQLITNRELVITSFTDSRQRLRYSELFYKLNYLRFSEVCFSCDFFYQDITISLKKKNVS